jgi:ribonuclease P protein component
VLPAAARLTSRDDFAEVIRHGRRAGRTLVVMHVLVPDQVRGDTAPDLTVPDALPQVPTQPGALAVADAAVEVAGPPRVGFVVSKAVGGSVVRHRVARRLRHLLRDRLDQFPSGTRLVVRALPRSATASSARLAADLDRALRVLLASADRS